jgi:four helix bundle protein
VLRRAKRLAQLAYRFVEQLPSSEAYGLQSQIRRASVSVVANIAEGLGRGTQGDLERHLRIAAGSAAETAALVDLAIDLHQADPSETTDLREELDAVRRMLHRFIAAVRRNRS